MAAYTLGLTGVRARHSVRDRTFIVATSFAMVGVLTNVPKQLVKEKRPFSSVDNSFPSGHTATTFMGAELVRIEYGGWYGAGAYVVAIGVGFMRMYNGRHWFHDVVAGAGIGILSARFGEWSWKWWSRIFEKRRRRLDCGFVLSPMLSPYGGGGCGVSVSGTF